MSSQELLENYGKAANVVKDFYLAKFIESMEDSENLPENFKDFAKEQGIDNDTVSKMIDAMPRALFDAFDAHKVYIQITVDLENNCFRWSFDGGHVESNDYTSRKEAETAAIEQAFEILNNKL
jgi:hypothetical protein